MQVAAFTAKFAVIGASFGATLGVGSALGVLALVLCGGGLIALLIGIVCCVLLRRRYSRNVLHKIFGGGGRHSQHRGVGYNASEELKAEKSCFAIFCCHPQDDDRANAQANEKATLELADALEMSTLERASRRSTITGNRITTNPIYERLNLVELPQISRHFLELRASIGQGAFGEVTEN